MSRYLNYLETHPLELEEMLKENPIAYVPFGALEWHGQHNVLGLDSLKASYICKKTAEITGGVLFPCVNYGAFRTMKFPYTLHSSKRPYKKMTKKIAKQLYNWGFKIIIFLTGHYPKNQIKQVANATKKVSKKHDDCFAIGIPEQALVTDLGYYGDHAASWETSLMMAINPEYVKLNRMEKGLNHPERAARWGVMGKDPLTDSSKEKGENILNEIINRLSEAVLKVKESQSINPFLAILQNYKKGMKEVFSSIDNMLKSQGMKDKREGLAFGIWWSLKRRKHKPEYRYKKKVK